MYIHLTRKSGNIFLDEKIIFTFSNLLCNSFCDTRKPVRQIRLHNHHPNRNTIVLIYIFHFYMKILFVHHKVYYLKSTNEIIMLD